MKIAITQRVIDYRNGPYDSIDHGFYSMFDSHQLVPIPNKLAHFKTSYITDADLVVFSGGNSMVDGDWQYNRERLIVEKHALDLALSHNKKILGISRGTQFLTMSLGGSIEETDQHKDDHTVYYNDTIKKVCSRHNELLSTLPPGVTQLAKDSQGYCESWKLENIGCVLWHPERMDDHWMPDEITSIAGLHLKG